MLSFRNQSDTLILVLHEIYGINEHITGVCRSLSQLGYDVLCPDLLDGKPPYDYDREEDAYRYFMNYAGFESSVKKIVFLLRGEGQAYRRIFLLGYSVGATIAWLSCGDYATLISGCHDLMPIERLSGMIGYYGSRIRDYTEADPKCPALLFFPEEETSFDPEELQRKLKNADHTKVHILEGKHGFADPYSNRYCKASADEADCMRNEFLEQTGR